MRAYLDVLRSRRARGPILAGGLSRLTPGMMNVSLVLAARQGGYAYAVAGLVAGAHQLGVGLGSPVQGRLADRLGHPRVLVPDALAYLVGAIALVVGLGSGWPVPVIAVIALATGATQPPTMVCLRSILGDLFGSGRDREAAFATTAATVELGFIVGPAAVVGLAATVGARWGILLAGLASAVGALWYAASTVVRAHPRTRQAHGRRGALASPGLRVLVGAYGVLSMSFGVFDVVAAAVAERAGVPAAAGTLISAIALGSLVGGVTYGSRTWPGSLLGRVRVLIVAFAATLAVVPLTLDRLVLMSVAVAVVGIALGPMNVCAFQLIDRLAPEGTRAEAQSWSQATVFAGSSVGAAIGGRLIDAGGPELAMVMSVGAAAVAALIVNLRSDRLATSAPMTSSVSGSATP